MPCKYIVGTGALLDWAMASWAEAEPALRLSPVDVGQAADYRFDLGSLPQPQPSDDDAVGDTAFVAWGAQFLNFRRLELMGELKGRGFRMPPLICKGAIVAASVKLAENVAIGAGAVIGANGRIGFNSVVGAGAVLGHGVQLGSSVWIGDGVQVGALARIGAQSTVEEGASIGIDMRIGKQSAIRRPGRYDLPIGDRTFVMADFDGPVVIVEG
jgi:carbonic anhydrase/acetyltransferase-like protein (isoleucine patch superfamily)